MTGRTCPECGADLTQLRAVRFGRRQRRPMMALWGAGLLLFAIAVAVMMPLILRVASGRGSPRGQTTAALTAGLATNINNTQVWYELSNRLVDGRPGGGEVDQVIEQLTTYLKAQQSQSTAVNLRHHVERFIEQVLQSQSASPATLARLYPVYYSGSPEIDSMHRAVRQGGVVAFEVDAQIRSRINSLRCVYALRQVTIDDTPVDVVSRHGQHEPLHPDHLSGYDHSNPNGLALKLDAAPGDHEVKFVFDVGVQPSNVPLVGMNSSPGHKSRWQSPLATWEKTITEKLVASATDESPIKLLTDPAHDLTGALQVVRAYTVPMRKGVRIAVLIVAGQSTTTPYCLRTKVRVLETEYAARNCFGAAANWNLNSGETKIDLPEVLPPNVDRITVILEPDPESGEKFPRLHTIWGKPLIFEDVPLERHDLE